MTVKSVLYSMLLLILVVFLIYFFTGVHLEVRRSNFNIVGGSVENSK
jgi:hypothetical protein